MTKVTSSIQVSELAAIIREHMLCLEHITLTKPDIVRSENAARAIITAIEGLGDEIHG